MNRRTAFVRWYDSQLGHGFLIPEEGGPDVFVHHSALHGSGLRALEPRDRVEYEVIETAYGPAAEGVFRTR
ncbi:cold-shock protein [Longimicrobium terrae]|uniref:CspA family cold shock protein n=1 Tax=Longimicrobium terrae TaxID=1639882 RepID=A0A841GNQ9_9BACT|nr:cold shock domain-containing protein [Longimicrobium terrae]MBB4635881.1 CspA family cold shock protein [Longimicrobium terrae]MBB6070277.1 CspA family cold shock protein [Longimicrobium terrae]NNC30781.1 cold shock domain-containing protein [Longimicrobium terrae]